MTTASTERTQVRRQQVLDAASDAFRRRGFHAASMAEIAKLAGMSPGHIYNLFENKDEIIAAIVERDCEETVQRIGELQRETDVLQAMLAQTEAAIDEHSQVANAALELEVLAEAGRNPKLAAVVHAAETLVKAKALDLIRQGLGPAADGLSAGEVEGRALLLAALFNGLTVMSVRLPDMSASGAHMAPAMRRVLQVLLTP
ncbi:TetR/AcrR family transcriptional regulator [Roseateles cellulosilyticus]|uniref:TetR/AcrR family transcriptional regulator n=1 Tax=Pelomonas cellulosilytica TaxID=2906762 RepID=A0ABS8XWS0_9BURK|nr:TetR/AcrR family transcriptional regulator [Pelomonas sp. P8]MCE4555297.1 TetR/AcrR family transcriptional regulator [Pelomonas sp. P8]